MFKKMLSLLILGGLSLMSLGMGQREVAVPAKPQVVVFDLAHKEIFTPYAEHRLNYSRFAQMIAQAGFQSTMNKGIITEKTLAGASTLVLYGPMIPLLEDEVHAITKFVQSGGNLLVMLHIASPAAELTKKFNIYVTNSIVLDESDKIDEASNFYARGIMAGHPLNKQIKSLAVYGSWGLMATEQAQITVATSPNAWEEQNGNHLHDNFEIPKRYGIVAVSENPGKVVVIADDAPFLDKFIDTGDNLLFAQNLIAWFKG